MTILITIRMGDIIYNDITYDGFTYNDNIYNDFNYNDNIYNTFLKKKMKSHKKLGFTKLSIYTKARDSQSRVETPYETPL